MFLHLSCHGFFGFSVGTLFTDISTWAVIRKPLKLHATLTFQASESLQDGGTLSSTKPLLLLLWSFSLPTSSPFGQQSSPIYIPLMRQGQSRGKSPTSTARTSAACLIGGVKISLETLHSLSDFIPIPYVNLAVDAATQIIKIAEVRIRSSFAESRAHPAND